MCCLPAGCSCTPGLLSRAAVSPIRVSLTALTSLPARHLPLLLPLPAGMSDAQWADVAAFYSYWGSFTSVKDFAWADQYHSASAPNRKVRLYLAWLGRCNATQLIHACCLL